MIFIDLFLLLFAVLLTDLLTIYIAFKIYNHIWACQKSCEIWDDGKIFQNKILDDQIILT